jgi:hypothetical protein
MTTKPPLDRCRAILNEMEKIPVIVPGKVSPRREAGGKVNGWKLQRWHNGHNETRHIPAALVERVKDGTRGHQRLMQLASEFSELRAQEVLGKPNAASASKKRPTTPL